MNVGILGTGDVGKALGRGFVTLGHAVKMGARDGRNEKAVAWAKEAGAAKNARAASSSANRQNATLLDITARPLPILTGATWQTRPGSSPSRAHCRGG